MFLKKISLCINECKRKEAIRSDLSKIEKKLENIELLFNRIENRFLEIKKKFKK